MKSLSSSPAVDALPNGMMPLDGVITAGQPTRAQLEELARQGVRTVVDLRAPGEPRGFEEPASARAAQLEYHNVPVGPSIGAPEFEQVRSLLRDRDRRPLLLHCASANRVGAALIPYLVLDENRSPEEALQIAHSVGLRSDELARQAMTYIRDNQNSKD